MDVWMKDNRSNDAVYVTGEGIGENGVFCSL